MATTITMLDPTGTPRQIPSDQKDAALKAGGKVVVRMFDPKGTARWIPEGEKEAALKAGGKLATTTPAPPPDPKSREGTYQMIGKDGKTVPVKYSDVIQHIHQGFSFADKKTLSTFAADHAADPNNSENRSDAAIRAMSNWNPLKYLAEIGAGPLDVLQGVGGKAVKVATAFDKPATSSGETVAQLAAAAPNKTAGQSIGAGGEQFGELVAAPETKLAEAAKVGKVAKAALTVAEQAARGATEQGAQTFVHTGGDTEEARHAAEIGALAGAGTEGVKALGRFAVDVGRHFAQVGEIQTAQLVRKTEKVNEVIAARASRIRADNDAKIAQYEKDVQEAKDKAAAANATEAQKTAAKQSQQEAESAADRLRHDNTVLEQEKLAAKRATQSRLVNQLRTRLAQRVQAIQSSAQDYFHKNYAEVEEAIDGTPDKPSGRTVPWEDLAEAVHDAKPKIEGSEESIKPFNDILKKVKRLEQAEQGEGISEEDLADLAPDERARLREEISGEGVSTGAKFADLKGYYSEAGRLLASPSTPGDVKQALVKFRDALDEMQQGLAEEAGIGQRYKLLRSQYKNYAEGFLDYQGPNKSGSPVALALKGEDDFHRTEPLVSKNLKPQEVSRIKQIIAGRPTDAATQFTEGKIGAGGPDAPEWRSRATQLLDNLRRAQHDLDALPKPKAVEPLEGKTVETSAPKTVEPDLPKPPKPKLIPEPKTLSPTELRAAKADALHKRANILNHFGTYVATSGLVGGVLALTLPGRTDPVKAIEHAGEGIIIGAVSPYILAKVLEKPGVVEALARPTKKDLEMLMKLPKEQRPQVEESLKWMAEEAERKGKLRGPSPWLRILSGTVAKQAGTSSSGPATPATITSGPMPLPATTPGVMPLPSSQQ